MSTLTGQFADDLRIVGYHQHTQIWLDEISAFQYHDMTGVAQPLWTPAVQAAAGRYLTPQPICVSGSPTAMSV